MKEKLKKVVVNGCYGGFGLSIKAKMKLINMKSKCVEISKLDDYYGGSKRYKKAPCYHPDWKDKFNEDFEKEQEDLGNGFFCFGWIKTITDKKFIYDVSRFELDRSNPDLIKVVEEMGEDANGDCAKLRIAEIPEDVEYEIDEYDGIESIHEVHRSW